MKITKTFKQKAIVLAISTFSVLSFVPTIANAQSGAMAWSVYDSTVDQTIKDKFDDKFKELNSNLKQWYSGLNETIKKVIDMGNVQVEQQATYQQTTDARARRAAADLRTMEDDETARPTLQKCVEVGRTSTRGGGGGVGSSGVSSSATAPGASGAAIAAAQTAAQQVETTRTTSSRLNQVLGGKTNLGTCVGTMKINGCGADGTHPGGDTDALSLYANVDTTKAKNVKSITVGNEGTTKVLSAANLSLDTKGVNVANSTMTHTIGMMPEKLTAQQATEASGYQAAWEVVKARSSFITAGLSNVIGWRTAMGKVPADWGAISGRYQEFFPEYATPTEPSYLEYMRLTAALENEKAMLNGTDTDPQAIAARAATLHNILLIRSMEKQDQVIGLLAAQLGQSINPVDRVRMENERQSFNSDKSVR